MMIWTKRKNDTELRLDKVTSKILEMLRSEDLELFSLGVRLLMAAEPNPEKQDEAIRKNMKRWAIEFKWKVDIFGGERDFEAKNRDYDITVSVIGANSTSFTSVNMTSSIQSYSAMLSV